MFPISRYRTNPLLNRNLSFFNRIFRHRLQSPIIQCTNLSGRGKSYEEKNVPEHCCHAYT